MNEGLRREIEEVASQSGDGLLRPEQLISYAADNPGSEMHKHFEWDDAEAATEYRRQQARQLIRMYVKFEPRVQRTVRGFISVPTDRLNEGGYRTVESVLDNPILRQQLVEQAINDITGLRRRYAHLPELDGVFNTLDGLVLQARNQKQTAAA